MVLKVFWNHLIAAYRSSKVVPPVSLSDQVVDYALREYQIYHTNFDALDAKSSSIVQFVAIILGLSAFQVASGGHISWLRFGALALFGLALLLALIAWCTRSVPGIPAVCDLQSRLDDLGIVTSRKELVDCLSESSESARKACVLKSKILRAAFGALFAGVIVLIASLMAGD